MPIQPVSGEIKSQELNDNFSYLESGNVEINRRVENIISEGTPTAGNMELIDGRLQSDGVIAPTIGSAIRQQNAISAGKNAINEAGKIDILTNEKLVTINPFNYFQGSYALSNGQFEENDTEAARNIRVKSSVVNFKGKSVTFIPKIGYEISLVIVKKTSIPGKYELQHSSGWFTNERKFKTNDELYFRFVLRNANNTAVFRENINSYLAIYQKNEIVENIDNIQELAVKNEGENNYIDQHSVEYLDIGTTYNISKFNAMNGRISFDVANNYFGFLLFNYENYEINFKLTHPSGWVCVDEDEQYLYMIPLINETQKGKLYTFSKVDFTLVNTTANSVLPINQAWTNVTVDTVFTVVKTNNSIRVYASKLETSVLLFEYPSSVFGFVSSNSSRHEVTNGFIKINRTITYPSLLERVRKLEIGSGSAGASNLDARFSNYKVLFAGDSITEKNFRANVNFVDNVTNWLKIADYHNEAKSGTGIVRPQSGVKNMYDRVDDWPEDLDLILISGNMNDFSDPSYFDESKIGQFGDTTLNTQYGAVKLFFKKIMNKYPLAKIGWITSTPRCYQSGDLAYTDYLWGKNGVFELANKAIIDTCQHYSIPALDLYHKSNLSPQITANRIAYFSSPSDPSGDGVHPNDAGHLLLSYKIYDFLKSNF